MKRMLSTCFLAIAIAPGIVAAQTPMSAAEFERYVEGKTLYFGFAGDKYGAERYLDNRRVEWSFLDGQCKEGFWYEQADQICFVYDDTPEPQCWTFFREPGGLKAIFENDPEATTLYEAQQNDKPMLCYGPEVGV
jgi:hypothetical protein